ncbi:MAG: transporter substrate-binding domain-containing protein [Desulfobacterales bacterium]|nr:transporter substrate-binding domain-containing protein [Desulfobacterales bacterium]
MHKFFLNFKPLLFFLTLLFVFEDINAEELSTLLIKGDDNYPPYEYLNEENEPEGFNVDIIRAVAREMGLSIQIELEIWSKVRSEIENGKIDALMGMFNTKERDKLVDFSVPHFIASYSVFVKKGSQISSIDDARKKKVVVQRDDLGHDYIVEKNITDSVVLKNTVRESLVSLSKGQVDCAVVSRLQGMIILKDEKIKNVAAVGPPIIQRKYCIAVTEGNAGLLAKINEGLSIIKTTGEYDRIYNKWFSVYEERGWKKERIIKYLVLIVSPLVLIIIAAFLWSWSLKKEVLKRTDALQESEQNLRGARNYISNIIDSMPSMMIGVDTDVNVIQWNRTAELITGIIAKEAEGKGLLELIPEVVSDIEIIMKSIRVKEIQKELNKSILENGEIHYDDITVYPLVTDGVEGAVIRIDDVTREHELEEQLNHSNKMDAIGQLAGGIAHDFNNMLGGILGAAQLLEYSGKNLDEKSLEYINLIIKSSMQAGDLTSKLLAFGRKGKIISTDIDIHEIIDDTISILKNSIDKKVSISINKKAKSSIITGDDTVIQNALINLGINASHAMEDGGVLSFETGNIEINQNYCDASVFDINPGNYIEISVRDTGCGIDSDTLKHIFDPFFTTKEQGEGTGLGLASVYGTVQNHNGVINVYSEIGTGTVFHIFLPNSEEGKVLSYTKETVKRGHGSGKLILIDDEEVIRITGKDILEEMGYEVTAFENALEAIEMFRKQYKEIELVITDMIMPKINGREVFYKLKEIDKDCRVILSSGFTRDEDVNDLKKNGLSGFISKPFKANELSELIKKVLN